MFLFFQTLNVVVDNCRDIKICRVLDCDTITQVKEKCLTQIYVNYPASNLTVRPEELELGKDCTSYTGFLFGCKTIFFHLWNDLSYLNRLMKFIYTCSPKKSADLNFWDCFEME